MFDYTMQHLNTITTMCVHSFVTFPSLIYHTLSNKLRPYTNIQKVQNINEQVTNSNIVIFVHGRNGSSADFLPLIENIKKNTIHVSDDRSTVIRLNSGSYVLKTIDLGPTAYSSLDDDSQVLKQELQTYTDCSIILVGLSKGGVVAMRYATTENDQRIKKVITISSPVQGTMCASLFPMSSSIYQNLGYQCPRIKQINESRKLKKIDTYHIVPKWDQLIIPSDAAKYDDVDESKIYYYNGCTYSHSGIQYSEDVCLAIIDWLD